MKDCDKFNPDKIFKKLKLVLLPTTYVGLYSSINVAVEDNLKTLVYMKTRFDNRIMTVEEAGKLSPDHRAFEIIIVDSHTLRIKFNPTNECIARARRNKNLLNLFIMDVRLMRASGDTRCCEDESHAEVSRYYLIGKYEFPRITHVPSLLNFEKTVMSTIKERNIVIINESTILAVMVRYCKEVGFWVEPKIFILEPKQSMNIKVRVKPWALKMAPAVFFKMNNPYNDEVGVLEKSLENTFNYSIKVKIDVIYHKLPKLNHIDSLHKIIEQQSKFAYIGTELVTHEKKMAMAKSHLIFSKVMARKPKFEDRVLKKKLDCEHPGDILSYESIFVIKKKHLTVLELLGVNVFPREIDFQNVIVHTESYEIITVKNKTSLDLTFQFFFHENIKYTDEKLGKFNVKVSSMSVFEITLYYTRDDIGLFYGSFEYSINNIFHFRHSFKVNVEYASLCLSDTILKFGMVTNEFFILSVPTRIINKHNVDVIYEWQEIDSDVPFKIIPRSGIVPRREFRQCDIIYTGTAAKSKTHSIVLHSCGNSVEVELVVISKKIAVKFLNANLNFDEIPLNIETSQMVTIENTSKEIAMFHILEPLMPGLTITPTSGNIRPKSLFSFIVNVTISCIMEFSTEINIKINNKEIVTLPVTGIVLEPKVVIQPKHIYVPRIPCGMITYVPLVIQNLGQLKSYVKFNDETERKICDLKCEFEVFIAQGQEKIKIENLSIEGNQVCTVYLKIYEADIKSYEEYLPIKVNHLIGPPDPNQRGATELQYFIRKFEELYLNNQKIKIRSINRDICSCKVMGVFFNPVLQFSVDKFEIDYQPDSENCVPFTITNIFRETLPITIMTGKIKPYFSLMLLSDDNESNEKDGVIKFDLQSGSEVIMLVRFSPPKMGRFVAVADLFLSKSLSIPFHNLTFIGRYVPSPIVPSTYCVTCAPAPLGYTFVKDVILRSDYELEIKDLKYHLEPDCPYVNISYEKYIEGTIKVKISITCDVQESGPCMLIIHNSKGTKCKIMMSYCFTSCPLTLHALHVITPQDNPYPFYPEENDSKFTTYMNVSIGFLEKWMYQQGFRRELNPEIPNTFHIISPLLVGQPGGKSTSTNVSFLIFLKRIAGPLLKNLNKFLNLNTNNKSAELEAIYDTYNEIIELIGSRGGHLGLMSAKYLLSYDQFIILKDMAKHVNEPEEYFDRELIKSRKKYESMNKQLWFDLILQCFKVFVLDCCFFDCRCEDKKPHDVIEVLLKWFNGHIELQNKKNLPSVEIKHLILRCDPKPPLTNLTTDVRDGIAFAIVTQYYCPFLEKQLQGLSKEYCKKRKEDVIHNASIIIESWNQLRLFFPVESEDFIRPNYIQMLFLSIHLYVVLPMMIPKDVLEFKPPLLRNSYRNVSVSTLVQEAVVCSYTILNNIHNNFVVEKNVPIENTVKKTVITVKYTANFTSKQTAALLFHCYNKTRIYDTYIVFTLIGDIGSIEPYRKCKINCPLYKHCKLEVVVDSPFKTDANYHMYISEEEPNIPVVFEESKQPKYLATRVNLIERNIILPGAPEDRSNDVFEQRLSLSVNCTSTHIGNAWIWFCSDVGEFYIKVTTNPRTDNPTDILYAKIRRWPIEQCNCGEDCECYRTGILMIPYKNPHMVQTLRFALIDRASETMLELLDELIETSNGKLILGMLLEEDGTDMAEVAHLLKEKVTYFITSRLLIIREPTMILNQHQDGEHPFIVTVPLLDEMPERFTLTLTSEDGADVRTYRVVFNQEDHMTV